MPNKIRMESVDSGSNYNFGDKLDIAANPRSAFDLTHLVNTTVDNAGPVFPLSWFYSLPGDDHDFSIDSLLRVLPQTVPLYSRQRLYIYVFHSYLSDLYENFEVFSRKGYSGNVEKTIPVLDSSNMKTTSETVKSGSLADYLGLPQGKLYDSAGVSALPFMMYLRIWRDYFVNKNYYINDRIILPDDDSRFRLGDDGQLLSARDLNKSFKFDITSNDSFGGLSYDSNGNAIFGLFPHDYPSDRFTSALPTTQRGDEALTPINAHLDWSDVVGSPAYQDKEMISKTAFSENSNNYVIGLSRSSYSSSDPINHISAFSLSNASSYAAINRNINTEYTNELLNVLNGVKVGGANISLNQLRALSVDQTIMERMARTDGSYGEFVLSMFGEKPKHSHDFRPTYVGGVYKDISFTEVLQTSNGDSSSPLGTYAGHGITGINDSYIGHHHADDYGMYMVLGCVMPDIYYSQGIDKKWSMITQSDLFLPERAKLGMVPVLNKELYYAGNNGNEQGEDNYLWAYQNIYDEYRYMENKISGKIADPSNLSFFPYTQSRHFNTLVNWGKEFAMADNVRKDYLSAPSEVAYSLQVKISDRAVRELPYRPVMSSII